MAIMTVSVTSRTREIGVRKALGATKRDILQQFLIEAATLTGIGGAIGIVVGLAFGRVVIACPRHRCTVPIMFTLIAVAVSVSIGIVFRMVRRSGGSLDRSRPAVTR
jgi:putative ABC transport system permease protein